MYVVFGSWVLTFYCFLFISFLKGEGGEERQERQCSMEEEITQETGGKCCYVYVKCAVCGSMSLLRLPVHDCLHERDISFVCLLKKFQPHNCKGLLFFATFTEILAPLPDAAVPEEEMEKEVEQSCEQAEIPAEDSSSKVELCSVSHPVKVSLCCFISGICISISQPE